MFGLVAFDQSNHMPEKILSMELQQFSKYSLATLFRMILPKKGVKNVMIITNQKSTHK